MIELPFLMLLEQLAGLDSTPVNGRIHPGVLPENCEYPAVVFTLISSPSAERRSDKTQHTTKRSLFQIDVWATTYLEAGQIAQSIEDAIDGYSGLIDGKHFKLVEVEDSRPGFDTTSEHHRRTLEIAVLHQ